MQRVAIVLKWTDYLWKSQEFFQKIFINIFLHCKLTSILINSIKVNDVKNYINNNSMIKKNQTSVLHSFQLNKIKSKIVGSGDLILIDCWNESLNNGKLAYQAPLWSIKWK